MPRASAPVRPSFSSAAGSRSGSGTTAFHLGLIDAERLERVAQRPCRRRSSRAASWSGTTTARALAIPTAREPPRAARARRARRGAPRRARSNRAARSAPARCRVRDHHEQHDRGALDEPAACRRPCRADFGLEQLDEQPALPPPSLTTGHARRAHVVAQHVEVARFVEDWLDAAISPAVSSSLSARSADRPRRRARPIKHRRDRANASRCRRETGSRRRASPPARRARHGRPTACSCPCDRCARACSCAIRRRRRSTDRRTIRRKCVRRGGGLSSGLRVSHIAS